MRTILLYLCAALFAGSSYAATPALFSSPTESKWNVTKGGVAAGTITLLTSSAGTRAEWRSSAKAPVQVLLGGNGKVWVRTTSGDTELETMSAMTPEYAVVPALLLPFTVSASDKVTAKSGKPATYTYRGGVTATYTFDSKGPSAIDVTVAGTKYTATRTSLTTSAADASNFAIRSKKGASARLAKLSGNLLGPTDTHVSATAGGRGVSGKGMKLNDGGNYDAVLALETRDEKWRAKLDGALTQFQQEGKVGKEGKE
jgi:hypothetical protein